MNTIVPLGESQFNYTDYTVWRFIHYWQQLDLVMSLQPRSVLEIGPGDHTIADFLRRKGIEVITADNDPAIKPDYLVNLLDPDFEKRFDQKFHLCLASEVLEHLSFEHFIKTLIKLGSLAEILAISVPYTTVRLFPDRPNYGRLVSCEGRLLTHIPFYFVNIPHDLLRFAKTLLKKRSLKEAKDRLRFGRQDYPDSYHGHHWDCGFWPFRPSKIRRMLSENFAIRLEKVYVNTNCIFWVLESR